MKFKLLLAFFSILFFSNNAFAQGGAFFFDRIEDASVGDLFTMKGLKAGHTYVCNFQRGFTTGLSETVVSPSGDITGTLVGDDYPAIQLEDDVDQINPVDNEELDTVATDNRIVFQATDSGNYNVRIAIWGTDDTTEDAFMDCIDVTQNVGFNTFVNNLNFLEVTNNLGRTLRVAWEAIKFDGTSISGAVDVAANTRSDIDIHSAVGPNSFGNLRIGVLGVEGAAILNLSQYQTTSSGVEQRTSRSTQSAGPSFGFR